MSYKTIFSAFSSESGMDVALAQANVLAMANDGHIDCLALGVDRSQAGYYYAGANAMILQETIARATQEAETLEGTLQTKLGGLEARSSCDSVVAQLVDIGRHVAARARFSDLAVLPQPYGEDRGVDFEAIVEGVMFDGQTPVLVVPEGSEAKAQPSRVTVAWNESAEALVAVRAALPLLRGADMVHIVVIDPPVHGPNRSDPGGMLSQYLARHGVRPEIDVLSRTMPRVSDILLRHAQDNSSDMIVMGAYGHSRFREAILGGATRYMLETTDRPVLMAH